MALIDEIDKDVAALIKALESRIAALEIQSDPSDEVVYIPPDSIVQNWDDRPSVTYRKVDD